MYTEQAIERLNHIDWKHVEENGHEKDMEYGIDFLTEMAAFCKENNITPNYPPFMTDLSSYFENCAIDDEILNKCNDDLRNRIENPSLSTAVISFYLKAAVLSDKDTKYIACMNVYEPIIRLFEKGGNFLYQERGMSFFGSGLISLENWYERFSKRHVKSGFPAAPTMLMSTAAGKSRKNNM